MDSNIDDFTQEEKNKLDNIIIKTIADIRMERNMEKLCQELLNAGCHFLAGSDHIAFFKKTDYEFYFGKTGDIKVEYLGFPQDA